MICYYKKCKYILCNIDFGVCIIFPKYTINAAFRKQNSIPYFLGQLIYVGLYQCITYRSFQVRMSMYLSVGVVWVQVQMAL